MKVTFPSISSNRHRRRAELAATLVEVAVGSAVLGLVFISLFGGMSMTTAQTKIAREDLRATQIMLERLEGLRLFDWNELLYSNSLCPPTFTNSFDPVGSSSGHGGMTYYGTVLITNVPFSPAPSYSNQLRSITVAVTWTNLGGAHNRSMTTYQAQYGMQNYVFNN